MCASVSEYVKCFDGAAEDKTLDRESEMRDVAGTSAAHHVFSGVSSNTGYSRFLHVFYVYAKNEKMSESKFRPAFVVSYHLTSNYGFMNLRLIVNLYVYYCVVTHDKH